MIVSKVIRRALRLLKAIDSNEEPSAQEQADALEALNAMLASWSSQPQAIYAPVLVSHTLVAGTLSYTWGTGGDINSPRPVEIRSAYVSDGTTDYPVFIRAIEDYAKIELKSMGGIPCEAFIRPSYPLATLYLHPVATETLTFKADVLQPFSTYAAADDFGLPAEFTDPITYQLAVRMGPEYRGVPQDVAALADHLFRSLKRQYSKPVPSVSSSPFSTRRYFDIQGG